MISIVIPVDFYSRKFNLLRHIIRWGACNYDNARIVMVINSRGSNLLKFLISQLYKGKVIWCDYSGIVNRSRLRNAALKVIQGDVLLSDIDLVISQDIIDGAVKRLSGTPFAMFPCLYRRKNYKTLVFNEKKINNIKSMRKYYLHLAIPSSVVAFHNDFLFFDESYIGHGYEDFDFIIRLLRKLGLYTITVEDLIDETYDVPILARGFRAKLALFAKETLDEGLIVEHIYHTRGDRSEYKIERESNRRRFGEKIQSMMDCKESVENIDLKKFFQIAGKYPQNLMLL